MDDIDWVPEGDTLDPYSDEEDWLPNWLPTHPRDTTLDDWI